MPVSEDKGKRNEEKLNERKEEAGNAEREAECGIQIDDEFIHVYESIERREGFNNE